MEPPAVPVVPAVTSPVATQDEKTLGIVMHIFGLIGLPIIGPLVIWLIKKDQSPYLDAQGRELLNFQMSCFIYVIISFILMFVLIGFLLVFVVAIGSVILTIIGIVKAAEGQVYRFPFCIRLM